MKKKLVVAFVIALVLALTFLAGMSYGASAIRLIVNGKDIAADVPPFITNGRTFVPIRFVAEALGYPVKWDAKTRTVYVGIPPEGVDLEPYKLDGTSLIREPATIGGVKYSRGFSGTAYFNLAGNYTTITFSAGMDDPTNSADDIGKIIAIGDRKDIASFEIPKSDLIKDFTLDVTGVRNLQLGTGFSHPVCFINVRGSAH